MRGGGITRVIIISLFATLVCAGIIKAATTIGTNISTDGNLTTGGSNTFSGSTSFIGTLTTSGANTFYGLTSFGGALTATSTLTVQGLTTLGNASTTLFSVSGNTWLATTTLSGNLNMGLKQIQNLVLENLSSFPSSPITGQIFWSTASSTPYWYDGSNWKRHTSGASYVVAASNALNKAADYIADGTCDDVEINAALANYTYAGTNGVEVILNGGIFTICDPIIIQGHSTLRGLNNEGTVIYLSDTFTTNDTISGITKSGTDLILTVADGSKWQAGDYIWISGIGTDAGGGNISNYLNDDEFCVAAVSSNTLTLGTVQSKWGSCASAKVNGNTLCGFPTGASCTVGTPSFTSAKIGATYDASRTGNNKNRAAIFHPEGSSSLELWTVIDRMTLNGNNTNVNGAHGIVTGDGTYTNQPYDTNLFNLFVRSFNGDGIRIDQGWGLEITNVVAEDNSGYGINIMRGGNWKMTGVKSVSNKKSGLAVGTVSTSPNGMIMNSEVTAYRNDSYRGFGIYLASGTVNTSISNVQINCTNNDCSQSGTYGSINLSGSQKYGIFGQAVSRIKISNSTLNGGTAAGYFDSTGSAIANNVITNNVFGQVSSVNAPIQFGAGGIGTGNIVENNVWSDMPVTTTAATDQFYGLTTLNGASSCNDGNGITRCYLNMASGNWPGQRKRYQMVTSATNPWIIRSAQHIYGLKYECWFDAVGEFAEFEYDGSAFKTITNTCTESYRVDNNNCSGGCSIDGDYPNVLVDTKDGALSGTLGDPNNDVSSSGGKRIVLRMVDSTSSGAITITHCDQDSNSDGDCVVTLDSTSDVCSFYWDNATSTPKWDLEKNSNCAISGT